LQFAHHIALSSDHSLKPFADLGEFPEITPGRSRLAPDIDLPGPIARLDRDLSDLMRQA
jgi:hypothetical protein